MLAELFGAGLAFISGFAFFGWAALVIMVILLIIAVNLFDDHSYGGATAAFVPTLILAGLVGRDYISAAIHAHGVVLGTIQLLAYYAVAGLAVSFVNWVFYSWHVKDRYQDAVIASVKTNWDAFAESIIAKLGTPTEDDPNNENIEVGNLAKYGLSQDHVKKYIQIKAIADNSRTIYGSAKIADAMTSITSSDRSSLMTNAVKDADKGLARMDAILHAMLPPKAIHCKTMLTATALEWPITVLHLLLARVIRTICDRVFWISRGFLDAVSKLAFGSHDVKI